MITQSQLKPFTLFDFILSHLLLVLNPAPLTCATSMDYGFDFDKEQLAQELCASLPAGITEQPLSSIEAEDFDTLYKWFVS